MQSSGMVRFIALVIVLAVIGSAGYLLMQPKDEAPSPIPDGGETPVVTMQTYESAKYGIGFSYPETYVLTERENPGSEMREHHSIILMDKVAAENIPVGGEGPPTINIDVFQNNLDTQSLENWVRNSSVSNFKLSPDGELRSMQVQGQPALAYTWDGLYRGESIVFEHDTHILMLSVTYLAPSDQIRADFDDIVASLSLR